ncbi:MAG TPA: DUF4386 domain-containing protein [Steroidobacteraceae bacterium]|nr:DUF4386 domain-containing protein [Steroidobacteraceae bacterium]
MTTAKNAGRIAGALILVQGIGGYVVNFGLIAPATAPPGFLVNAAPHALRVGMTALLGIFMGAFATAIAITVWPVFRKHSERMALSFLALAIAALALAVVENGRLMSMLSLSQAYAASGAADPAAFEGLRGVVAASRNWAHFTHLIIGGSTFFVLYATTFRFALIPRALAAFGMAAVALHMATVSLPLLGGHVIFPLLAPAGIANLALAVWLLAKGFADKSPATK